MLLVMTLALAPATGCFFAWVGLVFEAVGADSAASDHAEVPELDEVEL